MQQEKEELPPWANDYDAAEDVSRLSTEELRKLPPLRSPLSIDELKHARNMAILDGVAWGTSGGLLAMQISRWMRVGPVLSWATLAITAPTAGGYMWWISREPRIARQERDRIMRQHRLREEQAKGEPQMLEPIRPAFESVKPLRLSKEDLKE